MITPEDIAQIEAKSIGNASPVGTPRRGLPQRALGGALLLRISPFIKAIWGEMIRRYWNINFEEMMKAGLHLFDVLKNLFWCEPVRLILVVHLS